MKKNLASRLTFLAVVFGWALTARTQSTQDFHSMAAQLAGERESIEVGQTADPATQAREEKALAMLDAMALKALNVEGTPDIGALNKTLGSLVAGDNASGEDYEVVKFDGASTVYALVANFGIAGPSAVRLYAGPSAHLVLAGRIDCYDPPKFYDESLAVVPIPATDTLFMTIAGRTDDLQTGIFTVWHFDGQQLRQIWSSDLLQQSAYEADSSGVHLTYCAEPDNDHPGTCARMVRDSYTWENAEWKLHDSKTLPPSKPGA